MHRDLKPDNMFVRAEDASRDGPRFALVVGDVGLAKGVTHTLERVSLAGAPAYLAPEVAAQGAAEGCSLASDVYSASLVAVEMVTSECVYSACGPAVPGDGRREQLVARAQARAEAVLAFAEDSRLTVEALGALLEACTRRAPSERVTFRDIDARCRWPAAGGRADGGGRAEGGGGAAAAVVAAAPEVAAAAVPAAVAAAVPVAARVGAAAAAAAPLGAVAPQEDLAEQAAANAVRICAWLPSARRLQTGGRMRA